MLCVCITQAVVALTVVPVVIVAVALTVAVVPVVAVVATASSSYILIEQQTIIPFPISSYMYMLCLIFVIS